MREIKIFFTTEADLVWLNKHLVEHWQKKVGPDRVLTLEMGSFHPGWGGIQFYIHRPPLAPVAFGFSYDFIIWIKDVKGKTLWQNRDYNEDGSPKQK
ncbi:MAG: hypothetical protein A2V69_03560 [Candidatus Portnoybacteria bacterium RBG_13_40_8]|uniref:Uncharacterized protein n=1 Tax=Candidatus Portnoybacteria bacterium RBG_13_40_8 TaxID=1801990 RepID=A0A1G2F2Z3_9BACT|nr:MAG: hypothetical protein A2V69_03560 [Candidatus Portnoybacteria bacterium RBG_13_40_8]OGZ35025.1 MAG: hypothetical protein A2V60_01250 [Candidatus Portnoybacteria bacterium RIFCSPHIGHO2_01_FULL_39_19]